MARHLYEIICHLRTYSYMVKQALMYKETMCSVKILFHSFRVIFESQSFLTIKANLIADTYLQVLPLQYLSVLKRGMLDRTGQMLARVWWTMCRCEQMNWCGCCYNIGTPRSKTNYKNSKIMIEIIFRITTSLDD
jgi:hypothetical protein